MRSIQTRSGVGDLRYHHRETVTDATSEPLWIPPIEHDVTVVVDPGTSATVQFTISSREDIDADTAIWVDWDDGEVTEPSGRVINRAVSGLRLVSVGASAWEVSA